MEKVQEWWLSTVLFILLACAGGMLGAVVRMVDGKEKINWFIVTIETAASGFSGFIVMLLCQQLTLNLQWTGIIVGVCGWVGGRTTMLWLEKRVRKVVEGGDK